MFSRAALTLIAAAIGAACAQSDRVATADSARRDTSRLADSTDMKVAVPGALPSSSPRAVQWEGSAVADRLRGLGLTLAVDPDSVREPFLQTAGTRFIVRSSATDSADVLAFIYDEAVSAKRDVQALDTTKVAPRTMNVLWRAPVQLVTDNNLVAIVISERRELRRRIADALRSHPVR